MIAAISGGISVPEAREAVPPADYNWFKMPDLNRHTKRKLGKCGAGWTFTTIKSLVHLVARVGRPKARKAARELGRLGVGLQAIADEAGISVAKVRRDLVKLVDLGLVAVVRRNVEFNVDPATGKIIENRTGRSVAVVVFLTIGPEHCRTKAGRDRQASPAMAAPRNPATVEGQVMHDRDHSGGAIQRDVNTKRTPDGQADSVGLPQAQEGGPGAAGAGRLPAAQAGRHTPAQASQERTVRVDPGDDGLPVPIGRISRPKGRASKPSQDRRREFTADERQPPRTWAGPAEAARLRMLRDMDAERRRQAEADELFRQRHAKGHAGNTNLR